MAYIVQRSARLSGEDYSPGDTVPAEAIAGSEFTLQRLGFIALVPDTPSSDGTSDELAAAIARAEAAEARLAEAGISIDGAGDAQPFDPAEHNVGDVLGHVDANPDDLGRVLDAELGGKARKTLLDELDRRQGEAEAAEAEAGSAEADGGVR